MSDPGMDRGPADPAPEIPGGVFPEGDGFVVEAALLAAAFGLEPARVPELLRSGRMTSRHERGEAEDAGRYRLTFFFGGRALRLTVDGSGRILGRARFDTPGRAAD